MDLNGATNAYGYGKLLSWDEYPDAFDWSQSQKEFLPGEGLLVLEAQVRLLRFLVAAEKSSTTFHCRFPLRTYSLTAQGRHKGGRTMNPMAVNPLLY